MKPIEIELRVDCPVEQVWATFKNVEMMPHWVQGFDSIRTVEGEPEAIGSVHELTFQEGKRRVVMLQTVTAFEENSLFAFEATTTGMSNRCETQFLADGEATIIRSRNHFFATGFFFKLMLPLMKSPIRKRILADFGRLKALVESGGSAAA